MIPNLKDKLAQISAEQSSKPEKEEETALNLECSEYSSTFSSDYMIGSASIGDTSKIDYNTLSGICMEGSDHLLNKDDILYFDTETTGLGSGVSTVAFLVGVGYYQDNEFIVQQYLMNDYHQESSMLESLNNVLLGKKAVISFNGKAFDRHIVNNRSIMNRLIRPLENMIHLDIMHAARRLYSRRIGSCSMKNLEEKILGIFREDDIPGALIPEVFADYIKYGDSTMLKKVIEHNVQDIVNMTGIVKLLINAYNNPEDLSHKPDIFSQGIIFEKLGLVDRAKMCYNTLGVNKEAITRLAGISKAQKDYDKSIDYYSELTVIDSLNISHNIELSKIYEHRLKDFDKALSEVNRAILTKLSLTQLGYSTAKDDLDIRKQRILNKKAKKKGQTEKCHSEET